MDRSKGVALDPDRDPPAAEQIQVHQPPPDLGPGTIGQERLSRQQPLDRGMDLGGRRAGLLPRMKARFRR
jgi:hypothetical protein